MQLSFTVIKTKFLNEIKAKFSHKKSKFVLLLIFGSIMILMVVFGVAFRLNAGVDDWAEKGEPAGYEGEMKLKDGAGGGVSDGSVGVGGVGVGDTEQLELGEVANDWFYLDIEGAVNEPGIYALPVIAGRKPRLFQLIEAAGGFHRRVNRQQARVVVNLAAELADGQQIYIPFDFEPNEEPQNVKGGDQGTADGETAGNKISINNSSLESLKVLVGVGDTRAQNLIEGRPWASIEEAVEKKAITQKIVDDNVNKISI